MTQIHLSRHARRSINTRHVTCTFTCVQVTPSQMVLEQCEECDVALKVNFWV